MAERHKDALFIQNGACNPTAIIHRMLNAAEAIRAEDKERGAQSIGMPAITQDPALRLMTHQLCHLLKMRVADTSINAKATQSWIASGGFNWEHDVAECVKHVDLPTVEMCGFERFITSLEDRQTDEAATT